MRYIIVWILSGIVTAFSQQCFPESFIFGTATSAYQSEGGWNATGRGPSIWDEFCRQRNISCANIADDFFHRYPSDIALMKDMGLNGFRFSISWSRTMQWNGISFDRNFAGIEFYHDLLDHLQFHNITAIATLYHFDLPLALHTTLDPPGWLNRRSIGHYEQYATTMFLEYGHRIKYWATFNEPLSFTTGGYELGTRAPGLANSSSNVYVAAHHVLLAHAHAVASFRRLQAHGSVAQWSKIGIVLNFDYALPTNASLGQDIEAAELKNQFTIGWFLRPIVDGNYPIVMQQRVGARLPSFTPNERELLVQSYDLFMLNHYGTTLATFCASKRSSIPCSSLTKGWHYDLGVDFSSFPPGARVADKTNNRSNCKWFGAYPPGYKAAIEYVHNYNLTAPILLTENGWCGDARIKNENQLWYHKAYLQEVYDALRQGINILGYIVWSFSDNYEWGSYNPRFGLHYVNFPASIGDPNEQTLDQKWLQRIRRPAADFFESVATSKCLASESPHSERMAYCLIILFLLLAGLCLYYGYSKHRKTKYQTLMS